MRTAFARAYLALFAAMLPAIACADSRTSALAPVGDPRGKPELIVCSQNLENYGSYQDSKLRNPQLSQEAFREKERAIAQRIISKQCDVVAVQEVLGKDDETALNALKRLAGELRRISNRFYEVRVGPTLDRMSHVGYLVARDRAEINTTLSYAKVELPKLNPEEKPRLFIRAPFEIQLSVKPQGEGTGKTVTLINFHFKSRRGGGGDPAELEWETYRMAMAEAIRRIAELRHARSLASGETILVLLGDRNSNFDCASARILEGSLVLKSFLEGGTCRLSKRGVPLCQEGSVRPQKFFSVLTGDPQASLVPGTLQYEEEYSWLDDILLPAESLRYAWERFDSNGDYESGVVNTIRKASDHGMVWVALNW